MRNLIVIIQYEYKHLVRNKFKIFSLVLFIGAAVYSLQNGYELFQKHNSEIAAIKTKNAETIKKIEGWFDEGKKGPEDRPWINITTPFWAISNAPSTAVKTPSALMPFSIGQAEQFGYYKQVTNWSTMFDSDLAEEIANPERLATGTLDFSFVILYLLPALVIVLLFNIGGLEKDLGFDRLIRINSISQKKWLLARFAFYFFALIIVLLLLMLPYAILTGTFQNQISTYIKLFFYVCLYMSLWFSAFYFINLSGKGSTNRALKMVSVWLLFCIVLPGAIHQVASLKYPTSYMTDYIDAIREESNKLGELPNDTIRNKLLALYPILKETKHGRDTLIDEEILANSFRALVNDLMKNTALTIENNNKEKNRYIRNTYWINPISFFQNKINSLANNDYYSYKQFRHNIQSIFDKKVNTILLDCWNKEKVNKEKYLLYIEYFNN